MFDDSILGAPAHSNGRFGKSVAMDGDCVISGAPGPEELSGALTGGAYIHRRSTSGVWTQETELIEPTPALWDQFGWSVAIRDEVAIVGAPLRDSCGVGVNCNVGSAFVYRFNTGNGWQFEQEIAASDPAFGDEFGFDVAIEGDLLAVSAPFDDDNGSTSGSVYVFRRNSLGLWTQRSKLISSDGQAQDFFGNSVAISDGLIVVGASGESSFGASSGAGYVFVDLGGDNWVQQDKLVADDAFAGDQFGFDVAIDGDRIVAGAPLSDASCAGFLCNGGTAYVFAQQPDGGWSQETRLFADDTISSDFFGFGVGIAGPAVIASAVREDDQGNSAGAAYIFRRNDAGIWEQRAKLTDPNGRAGDELGFSAAISGIRAVAGARLDDNGCGVNGAGVPFNCDTGAVSIWTLGSLGNPNIADVNADGVVNGADLAALLTQFGMDGPADLNGDGVVNGADLAILLTNWGAV